jgi:hypothetical protein
LRNVRPEAVAPPAAVPGQRYPIAALLETFLLRSIARAGVVMESARDIAVRHDEERLLAATSAQCDKKAI